MVQENLIANRQRLFQLSRDLVFRFQGALEVLVQWPSSCLVARGAISVSHLYCVWIVTECALVKVLVRLWRSLANWKFINSFNYLCTNSVFFYFRFVSPSSLIRPLASKRSS